MENHIQLPVSITVSLDHFESWIVAVLEGGSNYRYHLKDVDTEGIKADEPLATFIARKLYTDPNYVLPVYDYEDENTHLGNLTQDSIFSTIERGLVYYSSDIDKLYSAVLDFLSLDVDADAADIFFQYALMGELIFG